MANQPDERIELSDFCIEKYANSRDVYVYGNGAPKRTIENAIERLIVGFYVSQGKEVVKRIPIPGFATGNEGITYAIYGDSKYAEAYVDLTPRGSIGKDNRPGPEVDYNTAYSRWTEERFKVSFSVVGSNFKVDKGVSIEVKDIFFDRVRYNQLDLLNACLDYNLRVGYKKPKRRR